MTTCQGVPEHGAIEGMSSGGQEQQAQRKHLDPT